MNHSIDYKKELEGAARTMILVHDPDTLIRLIVRMIVRKVKVVHAGMILFDPKRESYVLKISRGDAGVKVPAGFARFDKKNPLIRLFNEEILVQKKDKLLTGDLEKMMWQEAVIPNGNGRRELYNEASEQLHTLNTEACIPAFFRDELIAILLLGHKKDGGPFADDELDFFKALAFDAAMAIRNAQLFEDLKKEAERNRRLFINTTLALSSAVEAKDAYTRGHTERVTQYAEQIAWQMIENRSIKVPLGFMENLKNASLLHDIGKIGVPENILLKKGKLTDEEYNVIKQHPEKGANILNHIPEFEESIDGIKHHHERYDGKGYPDGLKGVQVPMIAAILAVADTFDAMTTDRPYRKGLTKKQAMDEIVQYSGTQFHPLPAQAIKELFDQGKI